MKKTKQWLQIALLIGVVVTLSACGKTDAVSQHSTGIWDRYVIYTLSQFLLWIAKLVGNHYALAIILFTIVLRTLLLPLTKMQMKSQRDMMEIQPELDKLKEKYPNKDRQSMEAMQEEQQALMKEHGVNQYAGCLPLLIQFPVMIALYQAIVRTPELRQGHFLWMNLGNPDPYFILPVLAAGLTFATSYFTMKANPSSNVTTKSMMYMMPLMILFISLGLPSAVAVYWVISNAITLAQTFIYNNPYKILAERQAKRDAEKAKQKALKKALKQAKNRK
ncbi:YidC/Oxa1 family membrane protein insertase [Vaginisenegalia massiliensis]|uniref:YidC/Oxa1 family membrane protein insertase n=1 Tax=Vaginisenegalia massiliensis TaxID=2058294 RepID=UPI000F53E5F3|nr:YidC/Oxa1 family membrane protein insertase [Vaginisenegalia massiliensis]